MASEKKVPVKRETEYVVLVGDPTKSWAVAGTYAATTALDAMKKAVAANGGHPSEVGIEWVAVPARSWKPMRRNVETVQKETWSS